MDLAAWLGANRSDTRGIARICNDVTGPKTRTYVPYSVKLCTSIFGGLLRADCKAIPSSPLLLWP